MSNPIEDKRPDERLKSMTVAELATATRLSEKNISLIEAGDWKAFPVQAYLRGYLNSISVKLSLDSKRVLDWYAAENGSKFASLLTDLSDGSQNKSNSAEGDKSSKGKAIVIILVVIGLALVVASKFFKEATPAQSAPEPVKTEVVEDEPAMETPEMPEGAEAVPVDSVNCCGTCRCFNRRNNQSCPCGRQGTGNQSGCGRFRPQEELRPSRFGNHFPFF